MDESGWMKGKGKKIVLPYKLSPELYAAEEKARYAVMRQSRLRLVALMRMGDEEEEERKRKKMQVEPRPLTAEEKEKMDDLKRSYEAIVPLLKGPYKRMKIEIPPVLLRDDQMKKELQILYP